VKQTNRCAAAWIAPLAIWGLLIQANNTVARLPDITLEELVKSSEYIAIGHTIRGQSSSQRARFSSTRMIKGKPTTTIWVCNSPSDPETQDLSILDGDYLLFAHPGQQCYEPVHGISSVVLFTGDKAVTVAIADQPPSQLISALVEKVQKLSLLQHTSK
jgi:hypothetical protein